MSTQININYESLSDDIKLYFTKFLKKTMYFFKHSKDSCINKFISQLFTYGRNTEELYPTSNIFGFFIISDQMYNVLDIIKKYSVRRKPYLNEDGLITSEYKNCCDKLYPYKVTNNITAFFNCLIKYRYKLDKCPQYKELKILIDIIKSEEPNIYKNIL